MHRSRLGLGTAQFGLNYGITNAAGRIREEEARAILAVADAAGIDTLDTAHLYGNSEQVLGRLRAADRFRIVTKTPKFATFGNSSEAADALRGAFEQSLAKLGRSSAYGLLLHDADDLMGPHGEALWAAMEELRTNGRVERIGVSVYHGAQIDAALDRFPLDLVQLPLNPLDRRLLDGGQLAQLAELRVEVHARSLFLQGLLLQEPEHMPGWLDPVKAAVADLHLRFAAAGLGRIEGIFAWALTLPIDRFICGVTSAAELQDVALAAEKAQMRGRAVDLAGAPSVDPAYLNPAAWPALAGAAADR